MAKKNSLSEMIDNCTNDFVASLIEAIKSATLEDLQSLGTPAKKRGRKPGRKPGAKKPGPKPGAKRKPGAKKPGPKPKKKAVNKKKIVKKIAKPAEKK